MEYREAAGGPVQDLPPSWRAWPFPPLEQGCVFYTGPGPLAFADASRDAVVFMHRRQTPEGRDLVVLLQVRGYARDFLPSAKGRILIFQYATVKPGSLIAAPERLKADDWVFPQWETLQDPFQLFAGQPDTSDPSRFTVNYTYDGIAGRIEGKVKNDGKLQLIVLDGPARRT